MAILDIPSLSAAGAMAGTDLFALTQGSAVPKKALLSSAATFVLAQDATLLAAFDNTVKVATASFVQQERVGKNYVRNSAFDISQLGTSFAATAYGPDLWKMLTTAGRTYSIQAGFNGGRKCFQAGRDAGQTGTTVLAIGHVLSTEDCMHLAGKQVMLSADIVAGANFSGTVLNAVIITGTGIDEALNLSSNTFPTGSTSSGSLTGGYLPNTTPTRRSFGPYTMPSSITEGGFRIAYTPVGTAGAADYFRCTRWKLEEGPVATRYEPEDTDHALAAAELRIQKSFLAATAPTTNAGAGTDEEQFDSGKAGAVALMVGRVRFKRRMLGAPTAITIYNPEAANNHVRDQIANADCSGESQINSTENGFTLLATGNAATAVGGRLAFHWLATKLDF